MNATGPSWLARGPGAITARIGLLLAAVACSKSTTAPARAGSEPRVVTFDELANWKYTEDLAGMPASVKALDRTRIALTGYVHAVVEGENRLHRDTAFELLVVKRKSYDRHSCDGPEQNETVTVTPPKDAATPQDLARMSGAWLERQPVQVIGTFVVECIRVDGYAMQIYGLRADSIEVVR